MLLSWAAHSATSPQLPQAPRPRARSEPRSCRSRHVRPHVTTLRAVGLGLRHLLPCWGPVAVRSLSCCRRLFGGSECPRAPPCVPLGRLLVAQPVEACLYPVDGDGCTDCNIPDRNAEPVRRKARTTATR